MAARPSAHQVARLAEFHPCLFPVADARPGVAQPPASLGQPFQDLARLLLGEDGLQLGADVPPPSFPQGRTSGCERFGGRHRGNDATEPAGADRGRESRWGSCLMLRARCHVHAAPIDFAREGTSMDTSAETFQLSLAAAEAYEAKFVPALFAEWAPPPCSTPPG